MSVGASRGPDVTLIGRAWDTSGAEIRAGYHPGAAGSGGATTPKPPTFALTGLAALALGEQGLRHWRAARRAA